MGVGRVLCVALPFALTVGSIIFLLVATLGGVSNTGLYVFRVNLTDLSINPLDIPDIIPRSALADAAAVNTLEQEEGSFEKRQAPGNITAADLGLGDLYDVSLWGYCRTNQDGERICQKPQFDWAASNVNSTTENLQNFAKAAAGKDIQLPKQLRDAVSAFSTLTKWTEVAFIAALLCLGVELFFGIFANCSRAWSCVTFIVAAIASVVTCTAASLATTMAVVVVGTVESTARFYGVRSSFNTTFLSLIWLAAACALGAGFFWLFTVCCCAPSHSSRRDRKRHTQDAEKLLPAGAYHPIHEPEHQGFYNNQHAPQYGAPRYPSGAPRSDIAYEPYAHRG